MTGLSIDCESPQRHDGRGDGDRLLETFLHGAGTYEDFINYQGAAAWAYQVDDILTDKCSEWRLLSNGELTGTQIQPYGRPRVYSSTRLREKYRGLSKHLYHRPPNHCRKLEASDLQTSKHPKDGPRCDFDNSFIRFLRDFFIANYVKMGALTVDNPRHSAVDQLTIKVDETPVLDEHHRLGQKEGGLNWAWKATMKQGKCTQVFFIMTYWPHDMLQDTTTTTTKTNMHVCIHMRILVCVQAACDKFADVVNDFISQEAQLVLLRGWDTLQVWASFHRPSYKPEGPLPSS
ncbi:unnamed protein product [Vitrella brassicaformis CCMP3155]|uniref:Uncharacterized protein n=1 Tax=Vitrella brassicaformis (strain CCMP3155) TaxID=1169540 RepID=A0A0G4H0S2_VITBC|nr:unnamed protein product [Vitrella brassicaformis CCMP3155]|eukprot:CEM37155.1 unnamed protein product [Vitrella brassicaformis CCMP3155]